MINDAHLRACFGLGSGEEIWKMSRALGLTREQTEMIQHLQVGEAINRKASGFTFPALVQCYQADLRQPTEQDWGTNEKRLKELQVLAQPCQPDDTQGPAFVGIKLSENARRLLKAMGDRPVSVMMEFYQSAALSGETGRKALEQLVRTGLVQEEEIPGAGSGKTKSAFLRPDGILAYKNITGKDPKRMFRTKQAGFSHDWWVNRVAAFFYRKQGAEFEIGKHLGKQEADLIITTEGKRTAYEVTLSLGNIQDKLSLLEHVDGLVYLYINENSKKEIQKKLTIPEELKDRVEFQPLKNYLK